ncbi:MAG: hypothetical protein JW800_04355 [Candidatus Omnitrophica bacterium]|nr:hypothetical protein [Candidatus Omnitrophota bacterium]
MSKAKIVKELVVKTANKLGMMEEVTSAIYKVGVNITALHAFGVDKEAVFRIVTEDNAKAMEGIKSRKLEVSERDVVAVELENKKGMAALMGKKIKDAGIDIKYIYGSTCGCSGSCTMIFNCTDNKRAATVLND